MQFEAKRTHLPFILITTLSNLCVNKFVPFIQKIRRRGRATPLQGFLEQIMRKPPRDHFR
uniref:Uncharacterized protein n=1 Tax=Glossina palpalis gambiensis TaxID=67801 RepID=A0A1B0C4J8_9MUSC